MMQARKFRLYSCDDLVGGCKDTIVNVNRRDHSEGEGTRRVASQMSYVGAGGGVGKVRGKRTVNWSIRQNRGWGGTVLDLKAVQGICQQVVDLVKAVDQVNDMKHQTPSLADQDGLPAQTQQAIRGARVRSQRGGCTVRMARRVANDMAGKARLGWQACLSELGEGKTAVERRPDDAARMSDTKQERCYGA